MLRKIKKSILSKSWQLKLKDYVYKKYKKQCKQQYGKQSLVLNAKQDLTAM
jgi:hypothetical protein